MRGEFVGKYQYCKTIAALKGCVRYCLMWKIAQTNKNKEDMGDGQNLYSLLTETTRRFGK